MLVLLAWAPWLVGVATVLFLVVCIMLIMTVLIQRPQGGGLAGAFGSGAGSGQTAFGAKTGDALTIFTIIVFVLFIGSAIVLNYAHHPDAPDPAAVIQPTNSEQGTPVTPAPQTGTPAEPAPLTSEPTGEPKPAEAPKTDAPADAPASPSTPK